MIGLKSKSNLIVFIIFVLTVFSLFFLAFFCIKSINVSNHVKILAMYESRVKQDKIKQINVVKETVLQKINQDNVALQLKKIEEEKNKKTEEEKKKLKAKEDEKLKSLEEKKQSNENKSEEDKDTNSNPQDTKPLQTTNAGNGDIASQLRASGLGEVQVAAIVANLRRESTLNPNAINPAGYQGLAQWGGGRLSRLKSTCGGLGDSTCQINFMLSEMNSGINGFSINQFNTYTDVNSANSYFKAHYEGAA